MAIVVEDNYLWQHYSGPIPPNHPILTTEASVQNFGQDAVITVKLTLDDPTRPNGDNLDTYLMTTAGLLTGPGLMLNNVPTQASLQLRGYQVPCVVCLTYLDATGNNWTRAWHINALH